MSDTLIVLQCRMGSRRLPGKALADVCGRSLLAHCIERLRLAAVAPVLVATTTAAEDDAVAAEARWLGADVFRGARDHVLERFVMAARQHGARLLVRATADNPAVDIDAPGRVLAAACAHGADYVTEQGLPHGAAVEAVSVAALETALTFSRDRCDHEHVTPFVLRRPDRFRVVPVVAPEGLRRPDLRLTVDTPEDLRFIREVLGAAADGGPAGPATLGAIIEAADRIRRPPVAGGRMIAVTRLDGTELLVNAELVERIEQTPDTLVGLVNGESLIVREAPDELVRRIVAYKQQIHAAPGPRPIARHRAGR